MLSINFETFIKEYPTANQVSKNVDMQNIFKILSNKENICEMVSKSEIGKPAMCAVINQIDEYCTNNNFELTHRLSTIIGNMISYIMRYFGYTRKARCTKDIPYIYKSKFIKSSGMYTLTLKPKYRVVTTIENI